MVAGGLGHLRRRAGGIAGARWKDSYAATRVASPGRSGLAGISSLHPGGFGLARIKAPPTRMAVDEPGWLSVGLAGRSA